MPIHLEDLDVTAGVSGATSALIVPCNMCPAVTVAANEKKPFIRLFRNFLRSAPFERYLKDLQSRLKEMGIRSQVFRSDVPHQWFVCMWTFGRRKKLRKRASEYDAAIVLGCDTATETVRDAVRSTGCKVVEGMQVTGLTNAKMKLRFPCNVTFEECKVIPISQKAGGAHDNGQTDPGGPAASTS